MNVEALLFGAIAIRKAQGLSLKAYGAEGYTSERPFTCHATSELQRDRWAQSLRSQGFTVESLEA